MSPEAYEVLRNKATEPAFSGAYDVEFRSSEYFCAACGAKLFDSGTEFYAHCGWPSFYDAIPGSVEFHDNSSNGMLRAEVKCANCGSQLGHVLAGEEYDIPIDRRYCVNSVSLKFEPKMNKARSEIDESDEAGSVSHHFTYGDRY